MDVGLWDQTMDILCQYTVIPLAAYNAHAWSEYKIVKSILVMTLYLGCVSNLSRIFALSPIMYQYFFHLAIVRSFAYKVRSTSDASEVRPPQLDRFKN